MTGWICHDGSECPINRDAIVRFRFANGQESDREYRAGNFLWRKRGYDFDIAAYQIVSGADVPTDAPAWTPKSGGY